MAYTTEELLVEVREDARAKDTLPPDNMVLRLANRVLQGVFTPLIQSVIQGYGITQETYTITPDTTSVPMPSRAFLSKAIDVRWRPSGVDTEYSIPHLGYDYAEENPWGNMGFSLRDNMIRLHAPRAGTLVVDYAYRPGKLVLSSTVDTLASAAALGATTLTTNSTYTSWTNGDKVDIVSAEAPYSLVYQGVVDSYSNPTITLTEATDVAVPAGAYVCQSEQTPIFPLPDEMYPAFVTSVAAALATRIYEGGELAQALSQQAAGFLNTIKASLQDRVTHEAENHVNWSSHLRLKYRSY